MLNAIRRFLKCKRGATSVEYAVVVSLILVVCLTAVQAVGQALNSAFTNIASSIAPQEDTGYQPPQRSRPPAAAPPASAKQ